MNEIHIYEFRNWMDENKLSISYVAKEFNMARKTVASWRQSEDTPEWLRYMMDGWNYRKLLRIEESKDQVLARMAKLLRHIHGELKTINDMTS